MSSLARGLPGGIQAQGMRRQPMQACLLWGRTAACDPHALGCGSTVDPTWSTVKRQKERHWERHFFFKKKETYVFEMSVFCFLTLSNVVKMFVCFLDVPFFDI